MFGNLNIEYNFLIFTIDSKTKHNCKSINEAVRIGDVEQLEDFVKNGASINELDITTKMTPVHWACFTGALEVYFVDEI